MHRHVLVTLLESVVLANVVKVITTDNDGPAHLHFGNNAGEDATTDVHVASEGTFLVNVVALNCLKRKSDYY